MSYKTSSDGRKLLHQLHGKKIKSVQNITTTDGIRISIGPELIGTDLEIKGE